MIDISIVVPIYNEVDSLEPLVSSIHDTMAKTGKSYEVVLVDDGSQDDSWNKMISLAERHPCLHLIRFRRNFGQTAAMSAGFTEARGQIIITMDADLQNDPADIPLLLAQIEAGYDVVSGWRKNRKDAFINRKLPSILANALISAMTGVPLHDYGCTLKAYRAEVIKDVHLYGEMHRFIPALASWVGGRVAEVAVNHHPRRFGKSKYGISRTSKVVLDLLTVKFLLHYSTRPIQIFGRIGMIFASLALLMLGTIFVDRLFVEHLASDYLLKRPFWIVTPLMLIGFCIQFISMGLLAEMQTRTYHEAQAKPIYVIREKREPRSTG